MRIAPASPYFGVNCVTVATSYGVAGRLGELRRRFWNVADARTEARRLNRAYALGHEHGVELAQAQSFVSAGPGDEGGAISGEPRT